LVIRRRSRGYTLIELVVAMSIMCIFLGILLTLTLEMFGWEKRLPINFLKHPQIIAVLSRMRRDVLDAHGTDPYRDAHDGYESSEKTLILETVSASGGVQIVVWDFSDPEVAVRRMYNVGNASQWSAFGVPIDFTIEAAEIAGRTPGVRLIAKDRKGRTSIDQTFFPRTTDDPLPPPPSP
jgi:prepilin-type N-terminal cleavage/methylation domain-containing protein